MDVDYRPKLSAHPYNALRHYPTILSLCSNYGSPLHKLHSRMLDRIHQFSFFIKHDFKERIKFRFKSFKVSLMILKTDTEKSLQKSA